VLYLMLLNRFSSASSTIWVIEGLSVEYTVQVLPTAATQKTFKALPVRCIGETPPGARGIRKFCDNHCTVDQLQLGIAHPATSQYTYGMHDFEHRS